MPLDSLKHDGPVNIRRVTIESPAVDRTFNPHTDIPPHFWEHVDRKIDELRKTGNYKELLCLAMHCRMAGRHVEISDDEIRGSLQLIDERRDRTDALTVFSALKALGRCPPVDAATKSLLQEGAESFAGRSASCILRDTAMINDPDVFSDGCKAEVRTDLFFFGLRNGMWRPRQFAQSAAAFRLLDEGVAITRAEWRALMVPGQLWSNLDSGFTVAQMPAHLSVLAAQRVEMTPSGLMVTHKQEPTSVFRFPEVPNFAHTLPL